MDTQADNGPGEPGIGTVSGGIAQGRILFSVESVAASGTFAFACIDPTGLHEIATEPDFTFAHAIWETPTTALFDSERNGYRHIFRMSVADGSVDQVTDGSVLSQEKAAMLPDGRIVHSQYSETADLGLHITSADGGSSAQLTPAGNPGDSGYDDAASVAPDGQTIVFVRYTTEQTGGLFLVSAAGGDAKRLTGDALNMGRPRWSPDGKSILYSAAGFVPDRPVLWTIPATGGDPVRLTEVTSGQAFEGDWSPDGSQIVFGYWEDGWDHNEMRLMNADGSDTRVLWKGRVSFANTPDWGP